MKIQRLLHAVTILSLLVLALASQQAAAQSLTQDINNDMQAQTGADFTSLLQPDGTLKVPEGMEGSFNVDGWQMTLDGDGQPHFYQPQAPNPAVNPSNTFWSHNFLLGVEDITYNAGNVYALAVAGDKVYVGGFFTAAGAVQANNIACWDTTDHQWTALGSGLNNAVYALAVHDNFVYVGGYFNYAGGVHTGPLARWDTTSHTWGTVGTLDQDIVSPTVYAISAAPNGDVYVGGSFNQVDTVSANNIARLTASGWDNLGGGVTGDSAEVRAIGQIIGVNVYVGGRFTHAGIQVASNLAFGDGIGWNTVGGGVGA